MPETKTLKKITPEQAYTLAYLLKRPKGVKSGPTKKKLFDRLGDDDLRAVAVEAIKIRDTPASSDATTSADPAAQVLADWAVER